MNSTLERGTLLHKRYRIVEILGQGGMGSVYRAIDENLGVDVAVKENLFTTEEYARQFRLEAVILANLRHPNLPRVTDHFVIPNQGQYLIMDYIEGEDLRQRMERVGTISEEEAILIGAAMCDALHYLHTRKPPIIHRDVKPGNVRITPDGHVYLVDFGLAKLVKGSQATTTGARAMTPGYSPPEQYGTARTDPRTDIYSLGATLYAALTGVIPEDGLARAMDNVELTPLRKRNPKVSRRLAAVIEKAMAIRPEDRYQTAEEFKQALLAANSKTQQLKGEVVVSPAPHVPPEEVPVVPPPAPVENRVPPVQPPPQPPSQPPSQPGGRWSTGFWVFFSFFLLTILIGLLGLIVFWSPVSRAFLGLLASDTPSLFQTAFPLDFTTTPTALPTETSNVAIQATATQTATLTPTPSKTPTGTFTPTEGPTFTFTPTWRGGGYGQLAIVSLRTGVPQIFLINSDGSGMKQITNMPDGACQPSWSPDGMRLVFISPCLQRQKEYSESHLYTINVDGSGLTQLPIPLGGFEPAWSPDGNRIAFTSKMDGTFQIYVLNLLDNSIAQLTAQSSDTKLPIWSRYPAWSPEGTQIIYSGYSHLTKAWQIWVMSDAGKGPSRLIYSDVIYYDFQPVWGPDGRTILFNQTRGPQQLGWLMKFDYEQRATTLYGSRFINGNFVANVDISPDGYWLAFDSLGPDGINFYVYLMTIGGQQRGRLTSYPEQEFDPAWRPLRK
ncbi:MAG: serine/threonine-protein kinase [Anaerolineales bacterium]|nr:serine/threonine-protein kinase [Anaerolineales bacterium]